MPLPVFLQELLGSRIDPAVQAQVKKIKSLPIMSSFTKKHGPEGMRIANDYVQNVLRGTHWRGVPKVTDLPKRFRAMPGRKELIKALQEGEAVVRAERNATRNMRLGAAGVAGGGLGTALAIDKTSSARENDSYVPAAIGGTVAAAPIATGLVDGALWPHLDKGVKYKQHGEVSRVIRPGDVLLTGEPGYTATKAGIALGGNGPDRFHVSIVGKHPRGGRTTVYEASPGHGGAQAAAWKPDKGESVTVLRLKERAKIKQLLKNLKSRVGKEDVLENMLGPNIRAQMYDLRAAGATGALDSVLPAAVRNRLPEINKPGTAFCSSLLGHACPVPIAKGVKPEHLMPYHVEHSPAFETIGHYRAPLTTQEKWIDRGMKASPWVARGLVGAGLGYGAYRLAKALSNNNKKAG